MTSFNEDGSINIKALVNWNAFYVYEDFPGNNTIAKVQAIVMLKQVLH